MKRFLLFMFVMLYTSLIVNVPSGYAMHENDHRYRIFGKVYDEAGKPVKDAKVLVVVVRIDEGVTVFTDSDGNYETVLHMHNDNLGDEILITALGVTKKTTADFVIDDKKAERGAEINFGDAASSASFGGGNNYIIYGAVGALLLGGVFYIVSKGSNKTTDKKAVGKGKKK